MNVTLSRYEAIYIDDQITAENKLIEDSVQNTVNLILDNPDRGAHYLDNSPTGEWSLVMQKLQELGHNANDVLKEQMTDDQRKKYDALLNWKKRVVLYEDYVMKLAEKGVLGIIDKDGGYMGDNGVWVDGGFKWNQEGFESRFPGSNYEELYRTLNSLRGDLTNAYHRANATGIMTDQDFLRERDMIPDAKSFFANAEIGMKFDTLHQLQGMSEDSFRSELIESNVYLTRIDEDLQKAGIARQTPFINMLAESIQSPEWHENRQGQ